MSLFTKRRKIVRQKQESDRKRWEENIEKQKISMNNVLKACDYIQEHHPEFESLDGDSRVKLFGEIFNKIHKNNE